MRDYSEFAEFLNKVLNERDRSGSWLARSLNVNPTTVCRWRNGETRPNSPEQVIRIADVLGVYDQHERQKLLLASGYGYQHVQEERAGKRSNQVKLVLKGEFPHLTEELLSAVVGALAGILNLSREQIAVSPSYR